MQSQLRATTVPTKKKTATVPLKAVAQTAVAPSTSYAQIESTPCVFATRVTIPVSSLGKSLVASIESYLASKMENKCSEHGYILPKSFHVKTTSLPKFYGKNCYVDIVCECNVFIPWVGMELRCKADTISKAGITAFSPDVTPSPFELVVMRDHCYDNPIFQSIQKGDIFVAKVIGINFELNDSSIYIVADPVSKESGEPV